MKSYARLSLITLAFVLLPHFSQQDSVNGKGKPNVNFYGTINDGIQGFKVENITIDGEYSQVPVYQLAPKETTSSYNPENNQTLLNFSEISKIMVAPNQEKQSFGNRNYTTMTVYLKDTQQTKNDYIIKSDATVFCDEITGAGLIKKKIKMCAIREIVFDGYKQQDPEITPVKKEAEPVKAADAKPSKTRRLFSYVKGAWRTITAI